MSHNGFESGDISLIYEVITGIDDIQSIPVIVTGIADFGLGKKFLIPWCVSGAWFYWCGQPLLT